MSNLGWECPKCHKCYAPTVAECLNCGNYSYPPADVGSQCVCHLKNVWTFIWCPVHDTYGSDWTTTSTITSASTDTKPNTEKVDLDPWSRMNEDEEPQDE